VTAFGPIESRPKSLFPPYDRYTDVDEGAHQAALEDALRGLKLGEYDRAMVEWLAGWETSTVATVISWIERAKKVNQ
jgi:hypothetical protein